MSQTHREREDEDDPLETIREESEAIDRLAEREDRIGAIARYFRDVAHGEVPDDYDAELAGMPKIGGDDS